MSETEAAAETPRPKTARRLARERAVQTIYTWLLNPGEARDIKRDARLEEDFPKLDAKLFDRLVDGVIADAPGCAPTSGRCSTARWRNCPRWSTRSFCSVRSS